MFGSGAYAQGTSKRPKSLVGSVRGVNISGYDNEKNFGNHSMSHSDNAQNIEEYEKLFQIMNGPIENLLNYSRD